MFFFQKTQGSADASDDESESGSDSEGSDEMTNRSKSKHCLLFSWDSLHFFFIHMCNINMDLCNQ